jgi:hypothetical protein
MEASGSISSAPETVSKTTSNRISYAPSRTGVEQGGGENVSMQGTVVGILTAPLQGETDRRVVFVAIGREQELRLHLGPDWYLKELGVKLEPGDLISFTGSRVTEDEEVIVLVSELHHRGRTVVLRNPDGQGVWRHPRTRE